MLNKEYFEAATHAAQAPWSLPGLARHLDLTIIKYPHSYLGHDALHARRHNGEDVMLYRVEQKDGSPSKFFSTKWIGLVSDQQGDSGDLFLIDV